MKILPLTAAIPFYLAQILIGSRCVEAADPVILDRLEAYVNAVPILRSDVERYLKNLKLRAQIDPLFPNSKMATKGSNASTEEVIDAMISDHLVEAEFPKSEAEVEQEITTIQTSNHIERNTLKDALRREGFSFSDYFDLIKESASKKELISREIQTKISVSDDDIKNYYLNHLPKNSQGHRSFHLQLISISPKNYKSPAAANQVAEDVLSKIKAGEAFEEVAKRFSDDATAPLGGDLGLLSEDQINPIIKSELKQLQIGEVSHLFKGGAGQLYILKLVDIKASETENLEKMREEIRAQLMTKEYSQQVKLWEERKRQSAVIHILGSPAVQSTAPKP
jgi:peptidyl-prolyl cis-trans isomerase SurA